MTTLLATRVAKAEAEATAEAARVLIAGGLVAFPTETVYGLGADATNGEAIARLYDAKGRPAFNPLIAHVPDVPAAKELVTFDDAAAALATAFWPGPLTLVLPKAATCPAAELVSAGLDTLAVRMPNHPVARAILKSFGGTIAAPSANRSGHVSPTTAAHVLADLGGRINFIVDGGPTPVGVESTIVACLGEPMLLRSGGLPRTAIERVLERKLATAPPAGAHDAPLSPGMLATHYAPRTRLRLHAEHPELGEALLAFGSVSPADAARAKTVLNLSPRGDLIEAAANLFAHLRALDGAGASAIAVMPVPGDGLGEAINDRLARAAAGR